MGPGASSDQSGNALKPDLQRSDLSQAKHSLVASYNTLASTTEKVSSSVRNNLQENSSCNGCTCTDPCLDLMAFGICSVSNCTTAALSGGTKDYCAVGSTLCPAPPDPEIRQNAADPGTSQRELVRAAKPTGAGTTTSHGKLHPTDRTTSHGRRTFGVSCNDCTCTEACSNLVAFGMCAVSTCETAALGNTRDYCAVDNLGCPTPSPTTEPSASPTTAAPTTAPTVAPTVVINSCQYSVTNTACQCELADCKSMGTFSHTALLSRCALLSRPSLLLLLAAARFSASCTCTSVHI